MMNKLGLEGTCVDMIKPQVIKARTNTRMNGPKLENVRLKMWNKTDTHSHHFNSIQYWKH